LQRLLAEIERFDSGQASLPDLQSAILGHGLAVDLGQQWHDLVNQVEGAIDMARFTTAPFRPHLERLRAAAQQALDAEPDDSE
jgi:hypothetical protein